MKTLRDTVKATWPKTVLNDSDGALTLYFVEVLFPLLVYVH